MFKSKHENKCLSRLATYISRELALLICKAVLLSNFSYCPLIWLFCNKGAKKEINRTHKRVVSMQFFYVVKIDIEKKHKRVLRMLSINHLSSSLVCEKKPVEYNLRTKNLCKLPTIRRASFGLESLSFRESFFWNTLDDSIKMNNHF